MRHQIMFCLIISGAALLCACSGSPKMMSRGELVKYIGDKDHGLTQEQEVNGIKVQVSYRPAALLTVQELCNGQLPRPEVIDSIESKYKKNYYFLLKYSKEGKESIRQLGNFSRYNEMLQVLSFQMSQFVNVTIPTRDTFRCAITSSIKHME